MKSKISILQLAVFLTVLVSLFGCQKDKNILTNCNCKNSNTKICVIYEQTYCADPWGQDNVDDETLIKNFKQHFNNLGVTLYNIGIDEKGTRQGCFACDCKSGKRFCAKVKNKDLDKVKEHGFKEK